MVEVAASPTIPPAPFRATESAEDTPAPRPDTPVEIGNPIAFESVTEVGVPRIGVTKVGEIANTAAPVPVSFVSAAARFALVGVPKKVAMPEPKEVMPVPPLATGSAVPESEIASVPDVVIGEPEIDRKDGTEAATLVTVPVPFTMPFADLKVAAFTGDVIAPVVLLTMRPDCPKAMPQRARNVRMRCFINYAAPAEKSR